MTATSCLLAGNYTCVAVNRNGSYQHKYTVVVIGEVVILQLQKNKKYETKRLEWQLITTSKKVNYSHYFSLYEFGDLSLVAMILAYFVLNIKYVF